jgi:hypothetical protein
LVVTSTAAVTYVTPFNVPVVTLGPDVPLSASTITGSVCAIAANGIASKDALNSALADLFMVIP